MITLHVGNVLPGHETVLKYVGYLFVLVQVNFLNN